MNTLPHWNFMNIKIEYTILSVNKIFLTWKKKRKKNILSVIITIKILVTQKNDI